MQIDSHHRFVKDWDTKLIKMLHDCDAGEYAMLTAYAQGFGQLDMTDGYSEVGLPDVPIFAMRWYQIWPDSAMPVCGGRTMEKHTEKLTKPFPTTCFSGHLSFSRGHLLKNAGY